MHRRLLPNPNCLAKNDTQNSHRLQKTRDLEKTDHCDCSNVGDVLFQKLSDMSKALQEFVVEAQDRKLSVVLVHVHAISANIKCHI